MQDVAQGLYELPVADGVLKEDIARAFAIAKAREEGPVGA